MEGSTQEQVEKRLAELPEDVQQAILSSEFEKKVQAIGAKYQLHVDQVGKLGDETMLVMLGFTSTADFVGNVVSHVGVPHEQASAVTADINNEILESVRASLKKFSEQQVPPTETTLKPSVAAPAPSTPIAKPQVPLAPHPHDLTLIEKTVTTPAPVGPSASGVASAKTPTPNAPSAQGTAAPAPPKPTDYKTDPYREPPV